MARHLPVSVALLAALASATSSAGAAGPAPQRGASPLVGQVLVAESGRPVVDAVVRLVDHTDAILELVFTDASGRFRLDQVPRVSIGSVYLAVDVDGFRPVRERVDQRYLSGLHVIYLEPSAPSGGTDPGVAGATPVDVRQLAAVIPEEAEEEYRKAVQESERGRPEEAIGHLERAVALAPDYHDAWIKLGIQHMELGHEAEAEAAYRSARASNPSGALAPLNLGILRYRQGELAGDSGDGETAGLRFEEASAFLEEAIRLSPASAPARFYMGATLYRLGSYPEAEDLLLDALGFDGSLSAARLMLINVYVRQDRLDAALDQSIIFLEEEPDSPQRPAIQDIRSRLEEALGR